MSNASEFGVDPTFDPIAAGFGRILRNAADARFANFRTKQKGGIQWTPPSRTLSLRVEFDSCRSNRCSVPAVPSRQHATISLKRRLPCDGQPSTSSSARQSPYAERPTSPGVWNLPRMKSYARRCGGDS